MTWKGHSKVDVPFGRRKDFFSSQEALNGIIYGTKLLTHNNFIDSGLNFYNKLNTLINQFTRFLLIDATKKQNYDLKIK